MAAAGIRPRAAYAVHDTSAAFALVEAGLGIAAPPGRPSPALAAFEAFAVPRLQREAR